MSFEEITFNLNEIKIIFSFFKIELLLDKLSDSFIVRNGRIELNPILGLEKFLSQILNSCY